MGLILGLLVAVIMAIVLVFVVIGVMSAIVWLLWTVIVAAAVAVLGGVAISLLLTGSGDATSATALLSGLAIFIIALAIGRGRRRRRLRQRLGQRGPVITVAATSPPKPVPPPVVPVQPFETEIGGDPKLAAAWVRLAGAADFARSRVGAARSSCALFLAAATRAPDNGDAADFAILIRKRVPERIDECFADCAAQTALEQRATLEATVADLERLGAIAEKRRAALLAAAGGPGERRSLLARRLDADPFA